MINSNMDKSLEDSLIEVVMTNEPELVKQYLSQGANPNKVTSRGKTSLGQAAYYGNLPIMKQLLDFSPLSTQSQATTTTSTVRKRHKSQKRKLSPSHDTVVKCKNANDKLDKELFKLPGLINGENSQLGHRNRGYYVFIHDDSSTDDGPGSVKKSSISPISITPSPQAELEWDEDLGTFAPVTIEDDTQSAIYKWYAAILETTGAALEFATLVSNGIDQQDVYLRTALHYAAEQGHVDALQMLLDAGCNVDVPATEGIIPLHIAVVKNREEIVKRLLAAGSRVNCKTHDKVTALHFAASRGFLEMCKILVAAGASLESGDTNERTPLYLATGRGHEHVVRFLITAGANVNSEEIRGYTPLCEAVTERHASLVKLLLESGARITHSHKLLHNAIMHNEEEIVRMLTQYNNAGINLRDDIGNTPLLTAILVGHPGVVKVLLRNGANINTINRITGANVLHMAIESVVTPKDYGELLLEFLEYNIDLNAIALTGDTALNRALLLHKDHAAALLIQHGADVNLWDLHSCGLDNLTIASRRKDPKLASLLVKAGHYIPPIERNLPIPKPGTTSNYLYHVCRQPLSLSDLGRIKIRSLHRKMIMHKFIHSLPLPKLLINFLMFEVEIGEIFQTSSI